MKAVYAALRAYLAGWKQYFRLADTPKVLTSLDEWIRHRLRQAQLKQWKRGTTVFRELRRLGTADDIARQIAGHARRWWRTSAKLLNLALPPTHYDAQGIPRLAG